MTLQPELPLLQRSDGTWVPDSVTEQGATSEGRGTSTFISTITSGGIVTTYENGSATVPSYGEVDSIYSKETLDLNTGEYKWHRDIHMSMSQGCAGSWVDTQDRTADLPITLDIGSPIASLSTVNPAFVNGISYPLPASVPAAEVVNAPPAGFLAADGVSAVALVFQSSSPYPVTFTLSASGANASGPGFLTPYTDAYLSDSRQRQRNNQHSCRVAGYGNGRTDGQLHT